MAVACNAERKLMRHIANVSIILSALCIAACDGDNLVLMDEQTQSPNNETADNQTTEWNSNFCGNYLDWNNMVSHQLVSNNPTDQVLRAYATEDEALDQSLVPQDVLFGLTRASTPVVYLQESVENLETGIVLSAIIPIWMPIRLSDPSGRNNWIDLNLDEIRMRFRQAGGRSFQAFDGTLNTFLPATGNTGGALDNYRCITDLPTQQGDLPGVTPPATTATNANGYSLVFVKAYLYRGQNDWSSFFSEV